MTKHFSKWASKQEIASGELAKVILGLSSDELNIAIKNGSFIEVE